MENQYTKRNKTVLQLLKFGAHSEEQDCVTTAQVRSTLRGTRLCYNFPISEP